MDKKYEFTGETMNFSGHVLHRIRALRDLDIAESGDLGGWIEKEENLDHDGNAWVFGNAKVYGNAMVLGNAHIYGMAEVYGNAYVYDNAEMCDHAKAFGTSRVYGNADIFGNASVYSNAHVHGDAEVSGEAKVHGNVHVYSTTELFGNAFVHTNADYAIVHGFGSHYRDTTFFRCIDGLVRVKCGCFRGTLEEFKAKVVETHKDSKIAKEYLMIADLMEMHFAE